MNNHFSSLRELSVCGLLLLTAACAKVGYDESRTEEDVAYRISSFDVNKYPLNKLICNPMGGEESLIDNGLKASLYYLSANQPRYSKVADYMKFGKPSEQFLFFTNVNVPTRLFDKGFPSQTGAMVKDDAGQNLIEYFALQMRSHLKLDPSKDSEGFYQLALLSDDGATLYQTDGDNSSKLLVDNDGLHPTRLGCGTRAVELKKGQFLPIELNYYQGPRMHIANVMMWRRVGSATEPLDASCGLTGNETFFDYNNNSKPQKAYNDLLARGWKPLSGSNFSVKQNSDYNPCTPGRAPIISQFRISEVGAKTVNLTWTTDIPATSQIRLVNMGNGSETLTRSDNLLRTSHSVTIDSLGFEINYMAQAISISETYGKAISSPINFRLLEFF